MAGEEATVLEDPQEAQAAIQDDQAVVESEDFSFTDGPEDAAPHEGLEEDDAEKKTEEPEGEAEGGEPTSEDAPPEPAPAAEQPGLDPGLLQAAAQMGLPADYVANFRDNDTLYATLQALDSQRQYYEQQWQQAQQQQPQQQQPQQQGQGYYQFQWGDEGEVDPVVRQQVEAYAAHVNQQMAPLLQSQQALAYHLQQVQQVQRAQEQYYQQQAAKDFQQRTDRWVSGLGTEWEGLLGKGSRDELPRDSEALSNRLELERVMHALWSGYAQQGTSVTEDQLRDQALHAAFGGQARELTRKQMGQAARNRQGQFTSRPTQRSAPVAKGDKAAESYVSRFLAERGVEDEEHKAGLLEG